MGLVRGRAAQMLWKEGGPSGPRGPGRRDPVGGHGLTGADGQRAYGGTKWEGEDAHRLRVTPRKARGWKSPEGRKGQSEQRATVTEANRTDRGRPARWAARGAALDDPAGGYGGSAPGSPRGEALRATVGGGYTPSVGVCSPLGWLTRRSGRRPCGPRAPPRPGAARLPCSRGLGPRRGASAISERTLCRSRVQPPLPPGGSGVLPLEAPARVPAGSEHGSRAPGCGEPRRCSAALDRAAAFQTAGSGPHPQKAPPRPCRVAQSGRRLAPRPGSRGGPRDGLDHSAPRRGGRTGPLRAGVEAWLSLGTGGVGGGTGRDPWHTP